MQVETIIEGLDNMTHTIESIEDLLTVLRSKNIYDFRVVHVLGRTVICKVSDVFTIKVKCKDIPQSDNVYRKLFDYGMRGNILYRGNNRKYVY